MGLDFQHFLMFTKNLLEIKKPKFKIAILN